ncbi:hypothetical protein GF407_02370 [candidate division KSB1 bacterium]|nr:hypothetical protein [candidate division KSB1 bacterium]
MCKQMIITRLKLFFILLLLPLLSQAMTGKRIVRVYIDDPGQRRWIEQQVFDVAGRGMSAYVDLVVNAAELQQLQQRGLRTEMLHDESLYKRTWSPGMGVFLTVDEIESGLHQRTDQYPSITYLTSIGKSIEGRDILALRLSANSPGVEGRASLLCFGGIHAREVISPLAVMRFLDYLLDNQHDLAVQEILDQADIWFIPCLNPDGLYYVEHVDNMWRKNRRDNGDGTFGVDLNRNFSFQWGFDNVGSSPLPSRETFRGAGPFSEPESRALRDFLQEHDFVASLSFHSYGDLVLFPWAYAAANTQHHSVFMNLASAMTAENGYGYGNFNLGSIYRVNGDSEDYIYSHRGEDNPVFAFTVEVGDSFFPAEEEVESLLAETLQANINLARVVDLLGINPQLILPPRQPGLISSRPDDNGCFYLYVIDSDSINPAVDYALSELQVLNQSTDASGPENALWRLQGFVRMPETPGSDEMVYKSDCRNRLPVKMTTTIPIEVDSGMVFHMRTRYFLYTDLNFAYLQVSTDSGNTFQNIAGNLTTQRNTYQKNKGDGITGISPGWLQAEFDLSMFAGRRIILRFLVEPNIHNENTWVMIDDLSPLPGAERAAPIMLSTPSSPLFQVYQPQRLYYQVRSRDNQSHLSAWSAVCTVDIDFGDKGDVNRDQIVDDNDLFLCEDLALHRLQDATAGQIYRSNIAADGDSSINIVDIIALNKRMQTP